MTILDAYALVALVAEEPAAAEVEELLRAGDAVASSVNLAETVDVLERVRLVDPLEVRRVIEPLIPDVLRVVPASEEHAWRAAEIRARHYRRRARPLSLADSFLVATAGGGDRVATADLPVAEVARAEGIEVVGLPDTSGRRP